MEEKSLDFSSLLDVVNLLSKKKIEKTNFVFTTIGVVKNCKDPEAGAYLIQADNTSYIAYSLDPSIIYELDTPVYILKTNKDDLDKKFILGSTSLINEDLNNRNNYLTKINDTGSAAFINAVRQYGKIMLEVNTPRLSSENKIIITLKNSSQVLTFDMSDMTVDNDSLVGITNQKKLFYIENYENFNGFDIVENTTGREPIFYPVVSDLIDDYSIEIFEKNNLNYIDDEDDIITLGFNSFIDNIKFIMSDYKCYWLKKGAQLEGCQYEKEGWGCVNERQTLDQYVGNATAAEGEKDIFISSPTLTIVKNDKLQADNIYKCIIVYNNRIIESDEFHVYYLDESSFSAILNITSENNIVSKEKTVQLEAAVETNYSKTYDCVYEWYLDDVKLEGENTNTCELNAIQILKNESNCYCMITIKIHGDKIAKIKSNNIVIYKEVTDGKDGINGKDGRAVISSQEQYCIALNDSQDPFGDSTTIYTDMDLVVNTYLKLGVEKDNYSIWTRTETKYSDGTFSYSTPSKQNATAAIAKWCMAEDITVINGASIATGTITAGQINTIGLTANRILIQDENNDIIFKASNGQYYDNGLKIEDKEVIISGFNIKKNSFIFSSSLSSIEGQTSQYKPFFWGAGWGNTFYLEPADYFGLSFQTQIQTEISRTGSDGKTQTYRYEKAAIATYIKQEGYDAIIDPILTSDIYFRKINYSDPMTSGILSCIIGNGQNSKTDLILKTSLFLDKDYGRICSASLFNRTVKSDIDTLGVCIGEPNRPIDKIYSKYYYVDYSNENSTFPLTKTGKTGYLFINNKYYCFYSGILCEISTTQPTNGLKEL